jgi:abortive infection bacteriophage resistance protein
VFIKHNFDKHDGEVPVWAAVEVLSFGTLSKIIKNLKTGTGSSYFILASNYQYRSKKGNLVNPSQKMLTSWIQSISVLRNMCAHNSRIYNRTIHTIPEILDIDKVTPLPVHNGLYQILLAMKYLRSSDKEWIEFVDAFDKLIQNNIDTVSLTAMNLPVDWKAHLSIKMQ